ncbi:MAG: hypothetical protein ACKOSO_00265 [Actinomycetota bacterium]
MTWLLAAQAFAALYMTGVIWMCQVAHYPLLHEVGDGLPAYQRRNRVRTTYVVGPAMLVELVAAAVLLVARPAAVPAWAAWLGIALVATCWAVTVLLSVPAHERLSARYDAAALDRLVRTNWIRTAAWTGHGALALWMLAVAV